MVLLPNTSAHADIGYPHLYTVKNWRTDSTSGRTSWLRHWLP